MNAAGLTFIESSGLMLCTVPVQFLTASWSSLSVDRDAAEESVPQILAALRDARP